MTAMRAWAAAIGVGALIGAAGCGGAGFTQGVPAEAGAETSAPAEASPEAAVEAAAVAEAGPVDAGIDVGHEASAPVDAAPEAAYVCDLSQWDAGFLCSSGIVGPGSCGPFNIASGHLEPGAASAACTWSCECPGGGRCCPGAPGYPGSCC